MDRRDFLKTAMAVTATSAITLVGCGSSNEPVLSNDDITIDGIFVDDSWRDKDSESSRLVVAVYTLTPASENLRTTADDLNLIIGDNRYDGYEHHNDVDLILPNYWKKHLANCYSSNTIRELYAGDTHKFFTLYRIPQVNLEETEIKFDHDEVDASTLHMTSEQIIICEDTEALVKQADPEGYEKTQDDLTPVSDSEAAAVGNALSGWTYTAYSTISTKLEFTGVNTFKFTIIGAGSREGTYEVTKGYLLGTYPGMEKPAIMVPYEKADTQNGYDVDIIDINTDLNQPNN